MNPALKLYLDKLHAETRAQYAEIHKQLQLQEALFSKFDTGASTPQPARSAVVASDGGHTVDATVVAVVPDTSSSTIKPHEVIAAPHGAFLDSIDLMPVTCSTECLTQEVEQLMPVSSIGTNTATAEVLSSAAITSEIIPSVAMAANPVSTKCLAETPVHASDSVQLLIATIDSADEAHATATTERFEHQPWPRPIQVQFSQVEHLFRPSPWPSFKLLSDTSYPEKPCSDTYRQSHGGPCFSPWLIRSMFREVPREDPIHYFQDPKMQLGCPVGFSWGLVVSLIRLVTPPQSEFHKSSYRPDCATNRAAVQSTKKHFNHSVQHWVLGISGGFSQAELEQLPVHSVAGYPEPFSCNQSHEVPYVSSALVPLSLRYDDPLQICCCKLILIDEPFSCFQGTKRQSRNLGGQRTFAIQTVYLISCMSKPCPWLSFDYFHEGTQLKCTWPKITYKGSHMEHLFRPRQWWSLKYDPVAGYLEELSSGSHHQSHEVSGFNVELVPLPFNDVNSPQVPYRQSNSMEESFCCLPVAKLQSGRPPDRATTGNIIHMPPVRVRISHMGHLFRPRPWPSFKYHSNDGYPAEPYSGIHNQPHGVSWFSARLVLFSFRDEDFILVCCGELIPMEEPFICLLPCETSYGFNWEMLALAVEILKEHLLLQPKPQWSAIALTKIDTYDTSTSNFGVYLVGTCLIMTEPELCADLISYQAKPGLHPLCMSASRALLVLIFDWPSSSERELIAGTMAISTEKLLQSSSFQCDQTCYLESGSTQACLKLNGVCATAVFLSEGYLSIWSELHIVVHEQVRQWAWCFYLEKSWSIRYLACNSQERGKFYEHHILEYAAGGILIPDKLQETTQILTVQWKILSKKQFQYTVRLVHQTCLTVKHTVSLQPWNSSTIQRQFLSQDKLKWSGCFARECRFEQLDDDSRARIQLAVLTNFHYCSFTIRPCCILLIRPLPEKRTSEDKNLLVHALFTDNMRSQSVTIQSFELCATFLSVEMDPLISTEAWEQCGWQHLISAGTYHLLSDCRLSNEGYHGDTIPKDLNFLSPKNSSKGFLPTARPNQVEFSVLAMESNGCLAQLRESGYNGYRFFAWVQFEYLFTISVDVRKCGTGTTKMGMTWDPGGLNFADMQNFKTRVLLPSSLMAPYICSNCFYKTQASRNQRLTGTGLRASRLLRRRGCQRPNSYQRQPKQQAHQLMGRAWLGAHRRSTDYKYPDLA